MLTLGRRTGARWGSSDLAVRVAAFAFGLLAASCGNPVVDSGGRDAARDVVDPGVDSRADAASDGTPDDGAADVASDSSPADVAPPAALSASPPGHDFGNVEVGVATETVPWTITNLGGVATGSLTLANTAPNDIIVANGCTAALDPSASCTIMVAFKATSAGMRTGMLTLTANPGGAVTFAVTARGQYRLTIVKSGTGTVASTPGAIDCGQACSALVDPGTVTLRADTTNGSGFFFSGWSGGGCSGPARACDATIAGPTTITANFSAMMANLIFMTGPTVPANLGSAAAYDPKCNEIATSAGINTASGDGYIAYISDAALSAPSRVGTTARGWVRLDGKPFADTLTNLTTLDGAVYNDISFDERGNALVSSYAFTGTLPTGAWDSMFSCNGWTTTSADVRVDVGRADGGPNHWVTGATVPCDAPASLICVGKTRASVVVPVVTAGKRIWQSTSYFKAGDSQSPDAKCGAERPAGVADGRALIATTTRQAATVLDPAAVYVRPDGTRVGTGALIAQGFGLESGIWQTATGQYQSRYAVWTGSATPSAVGTISSTCNDWQDTSSASFGTSGVSGLAFVLWWSGSVAACSGAWPIYCVEP